MRDTAERPEGVEAGTLLGTQEETIYEWFTKLLDDEVEYEKMAHAANPYGDGHACERIADVLEGKEYSPWVVEYAGEYGHLVKELAEDCGYEKIAFLDDNSPEAIGTVADAAKWKDDYAEFVAAIGNPAVRETVVGALEELFSLAILIILQRTSAGLL